jgi:hypothetical protein
MPVRVWDTATGKELRKVRGKKRWFDAVCSPDARVIAVADE